MLPKGFNSLAIPVPAASLELNWPKTGLPFGQEMAKAGLFRRSDSQLNENKFPCLGSGLKNKP